MGGVFGGSKQKSTTSNQAYPYIKDTFGSTAGATGGATNALSALLGLGGDTAGQSAAFDNYRDSTGYDFKMDQGTRAITGSAAAKGLLKSGATAKALEGYGQNLADTTFNDYISQLFNLGNLGLGAGNVIANAGQTTKSSGSSKPGLGGFLGSAASSFAASDRRLKMNIVKLYEREDGLGVYTYNYINGKGPYRGVMADEVAKIKPEALGPVIDGFATVDYAKIGAI